MMSKYEVEIIPLMNRRGSGISMRPNVLSPNSRLPFVRGILCNAWKQLARFRLVPRSAPLQTGGGRESPRFSDALDKTAPRFQAKPADSLFDASGGTGAKFGGRVSAKVNENTASKQKYVQNG